MTDDQRKRMEKMRKQFENMTDEQKAQMREKFQNMSPEERAKEMRKLMGQ